MAGVGTLPRWRLTREELFFRALASLAGTALCCRFEHERDRAPPTTAVLERRGARRRLARDRHRDHRKGRRERGALGRSVGVAPARQAAPRHGALGGGPRRCQWDV